MKSWTSMIAAGTALAILPQQSWAQETARQCTSVPNASGIELLISVEGAPGRYSLTCQNGALVAVPAEAAGLVTSPTASEQATQSAANTAGAMISGEMQIGRNMAGISSSDEQGNENAGAKDAPNDAASSQESENAASTETQIENSAEETADDLKEGSPDLDEPPAALETDKATENETGAGTASDDVTAESFAEEPQNQMPDDIPSMATVDQSTGTTNEAPVVSKPQSAVTETGPGSLSQQMAAASQAPGADGEAETEPAAGEMTSSESGDGGSKKSAEGETSPEEPDAAPQAMGAPSKSGPGTLEEQMAAAAAGNGSSGAPSQSGPGTLAQQMSAATARSADTEDTADASDESEATSTSENMSPSLETTGVPSKSGPGTLAEQMAAATAGNGSSGAPSQSGPGTLEQQMSAATARSADTEDTADASDESEATSTSENMSASLETTGVPSKSGPGTLEEQMAAATAGNGSSGAPSQSGPGTLEQQMSAATAQSANAKSDTPDSGSMTEAGTDQAPDENGDQMAAVSPAPSTGQQNSAPPADDRIAVPANVIASARLALPGIDFRSVSVRDEESGKLFALRGEGPGGIPVSIAVEADGQIVSVDRQIEPEQVPNQVERIATALLPDHSVDRVILSTRENYTSYFIFEGTDSASVPFALEVRSDGQAARFVRAN
ncbi:hypothetical protein [Fulvimarina sp. MAC3]|uniref:hypothetical protein n=1 Tax=Fulvimarina sp. MAC3 TaxID=3148887 RepID=UPI0031FC3BB2